MVQVRDLGIEGDDVVDDKDCYDKIILATRAEYCEHDENWLFPYICSLIYNISSTFGIGLDKIPLVTLIMMMKMVLILSVFSVLSHCF